MLTREEALERARAHLDALARAPGGEPYVTTSAQERPRAWLVCFTTRRHAEGGDLGDEPVGQGPLLIEKEGGRLHALGSAQAGERALADYERALFAAADLERRLRALAPGAPALPPRVERALRAACPDEAAAAEARALLRGFARAHRQDRGEDPRERALLALARGAAGRVALLAALAAALAPTDEAQGA